LNNNGKTIIDITDKEKFNNFLQKLLNYKDFEIIAEKAQELIKLNIENIEKTIKELVNDFLLKVKKNKNWDLNKKSIRVAILICLNNLLEEKFIIELIKKHGNIIICICLTLLCGKLNESWLLMKITEIYKNVKKMIHHEIYLYLSVLENKSINNNKKYN